MNERLQDRYLTTDDKLAGVADHVAQLPTIGERRAFIARWRKRHGADLTERLKTKVQEAWHERH